MSAFLLARLRGAMSRWLVLNREYAERWPNITTKKDTAKDAGAYRKEMGKFDKLLFAQAG
jgi:ferredoxin